MTLSQLDELRTKSRWAREKYYRLVAYIDSGEAPIEANLHLWVLGAKRKYAQAKAEAAVAEWIAQDCKELPGYFPPKEYLGGRKTRSCNRHDDCDAADARAKAYYEENQKKPYRERRDGLWAYADHCHDDCCEDCLGS